METGDLTRSNGTDAEFSAKTVITAGNQAVATNIISFAAEDSSNTWNLDAVSMGFFPALENISFLRAQVGGGMSRLSFAADSLSVQQTNIRAALGRIEDVDIAEEVRTYRSTAFLRRQRHPWSHRPTVPMMWL